MVTISEKHLPRNTKLRVQVLLDEADAHWFQLHSDEQHRIRFHFKGEHMDDRGEPARYIIVTRQPDGTLTRRFEREGGQA